MTRLAWGILGTGSIAHTFARGVQRSRTGVLAAVGSRTAEAAARFGAEFAITRCHGSYEALLADPAVEAVYISTPHPMHAAWAIRAAEAGKHLLCEKPLTITARQAETVIDAARRHDIFLMEAFMYRCHPQTARLVELVRDGAVGRVSLIEASFGYDIRGADIPRLEDPALGGGAILDVGCYPTSMTRLLAGAALGQPWVEPLDVAGAGRLSPAGVDEYAAALLRFPGDITATLVTGFRLSMENSVRVHGSEGVLTVPAPWLCTGEGGTARLHLHRHGHTAEEITLEVPEGLYAIEADTVAAHLAARQAPAMPWGDTLGNMQTLDRWRAAVGVRYAEDA